GGDRGGGAPGGGNGGWHGEGGCARARVPWAAAAAQLRTERASWAAASRQGARARGPQPRDRTRHSRRRDHGSTITFKAPSIRSLNVRSASRKSASLK